MKSKGKGRRWSEWSNTIRSRQRGYTNGAQYGPDMASVFASGGVLADQSECYQFVVLIA